MLNKIILTGRLTAKPELKTTTSGVSVAIFSLAVQRNYKDKSGEYPTDFLNCVSYRNQAEFITRFFDKGQLITVVGSFTSRRYEDSNGNKRTAFEVVIDESLFAESKGEKQSAPSFTPPTTTGGNDAEFEEVTDEELPF